MISRPNVKLHNLIARRRMFKDYMDKYGDDLRNKSIIKNVIEKTEKEILNYTDSITVENRLREINI